MGAAIAAHLANVGIPSYLLDIVPTSLTDDEKKRGLTLQPARGPQPDRPSGDCSAA